MQPNGLRAAHRGCALLRHLSGCRNGLDLGPLGGAAEHGAQIRMACAGWKPVELIQHCEPAKIAIAVSPGAVEVAQRSESKDAVGAEQSAEQNRAVCAHRLAYRGDRRRLKRRHQPVEGRSSLQRVVPEARNPVLTRGWRDSGPECG